MNVYIFLAVSEDGFVAPTDHSLDWLPEDGGDAGFEQMLEQCASVLMGRGTYDSVIAAGVWPYTIPVFVATHRPIAAGGPENVYPLEGSIDEMLALLPDGDVYLDGPDLINQALARGLVDRAIITTIPVALGEGIPLPNPKQGPRQVEELHEHRLSSGLWQRTYDLFY